VLAVLYHMGTLCPRYGRSVSGCHVQIFVSVYIGCPAGLAQTEKFDRCHLLSCLNVTELNIKN